MPWLHLTHQASGRPLFSLLSITIPPRLVSLTTGGCNWNVPDSVALLHRSFANSFVPEVYIAQVWSRCCSSVCDSVNRRHRISQQCLALLDAAEQAHAVCSKDSSIYLRKCTWMCVQAAVQILESRLLPEPVNSLT